MSKFSFLMLSLLLLITGVYGIGVDIIRHPGGPPTDIEIRVTHDGEPPNPITDFHFSVSMPCQIISVEGPTGWTLRYALPNSFAEMDADASSEIVAGGTGTFHVVIDGPCEDATYTFYLTSGGTVIPGTEREGPIGGLGIGETDIPRNFGLDISPNPFNSAVTISFSGGVGATNGRTGQVGIEIFDISGHMVADLPVTTCGIPQVVPTPVAWTPEKSLGSGIYLVRARFGGETSTKRVVYLK
jgi:hypothetical protein